MRRIFKYGDIQNVSLTSDKELNILIYRNPSYAIILRSYKLQNIVSFFGQPCVYGLIEALKLCANLQFELLDCLMIEVA